jgi:Fic family protein
VADRKTEPERASRPLPVPIPKDPEEIARLEARNGLRQFDAVVQTIDDALKAGRQFRLRPSLALELNRLAIDGVNEFAGGYRTFPIEISGSKHQPPPAREVPSLVENMCDYVNDQWQKTPIHLTAYLMWRMNWIHPFPDGNGRTARAVSYAVLCIRLGYRLPGTRTIPEQIASNKFPYYDALEAADQALSENRLDVSAMEELLSGTLAKQLMDVHRAATGQRGTPGETPGT